MNVNAYPAFLIIYAFHDFYRAYHSLLCAFCARGCPFSLCAYVLCACALSSSFFSGYGLLMGLAPLDHELLLSLCHSFMS